jgi:hypothetical protein
MGGERRICAFGSNPPLSYELEERSPQPVGWVELFAKPITRRQIVGWVQPTGPAFPIISSTILITRSRGEVMDFEELDPIPRTTRTLPHGEERASSARVSNHAGEYSSFETRRRRRSSELVKEY